MHYLKFYLFHLLGVLTIVSIGLGGYWIYAGYAGLTLFIIVGDVMLGEDLSIPKIRHPWLYTAQLWLALPLVVGLFLVSMYQFAASDALIHTWLGTTHTSYSMGEFLVAALFAGLLIGTLGTVTAHELVHRKWGSISHQIGRWLLSFSFDSNFAIEHVYGHHINVATEKDAASAPRGRNVYQHIWRSTIDGNRSAWRIEEKRLQRQNSATWSFKNRFLMGVLQSVLLLGLAYMLAGTSGLVFLIIAGTVAKIDLEIVNYMEHYGLVRKVGKRVFPRHSWNTTTKISSWSLFNLTRHAHHHANANVPFQNLKPFTDAPIMPSGYLGTMLLTLIPPLWYKVMEPKLAQWDATHASEEELALLRESGQLKGNV